METGATVLIRAPVSLYSSEPFHSVCTMYSVRLHWWHDTGAIFLYSVVTAQPAAAATTTATWSVARSIAVTRLCSENANLR